MTTVLIVEDEAITALDLKYNLEELGYEILDIVDNAQEAVDIAAEKCPDITIMDIKLKGPMTGIEASKLIMQLDLPVIYLTANTDDGTFGDALENSPSYAFIGKPFDKKILKHNIECAINRSDIENEKLNLAYGFVK
ncbi:MAG: response regulator [Methanosphaera sp. rholeuAM6]|nr:MAG: response regulator [Methanosphaera sp. rholeuAM6]